MYVHTCTSRVQCQERWEKTQARCGKNTWGVKKRVFMSIPEVRKAPALRIFKFLLRGSLEEDRSRISTRTSHRDLHEIMKGHPKGFLQVLFKSFSQGPVQDHAKSPNGISLGSPQELLTRTCKRPSPRSSCQDPSEKGGKIAKKRRTAAWSGSYEILRQEPPKSLPEELSDKHL